MSHSPWWKRKIEELFGIDLRSLALLRISMALIVLADLYWRSGDLRAHYTDFGILPRYALLEKFAHPWYMSFHLASGTSFVTGLLFVIHAVFAVMLLVGYRTRLANFGTWILLISLHTRNPYLLQGGDALLRMMLFWSLFLPLGARYSVDSTLYLSSKQMPNRYLSWGTVAYLGQVVMMWVFAAMLKTGSDWEKGTAIYYALSIDSFATPLAKYMLMMPLSVLKSMTWFTLYFERYGSILLFIPVLTGPLRTIGIGIYLVLILGFRLGIEVGLFTWICCAAMFPFIPSWFWDRLLKGFRRTGKPPLQIYYDETSAWIKNSVRLIHTFFLRSQTALLPSQEYPEIESERKTRQSCIAVVSEGSRYYNFDAIRAICDHSALLWIFRPLFRWGPVQRFGNVICHDVYMAQAASPGPAEPIHVRPYAAGPKWWTQTVPLILLLYVLFWNLGTVQNSKWSVPGDMRWFGILFQLDQRWNMFSPNVYKDDGWYVIPGKLRDGTLVDIYRDGAPVTWEKPELVSRDYRTQRWRKYLTTIHSKRRTALRLYYARYLCREWNQSHPFSKQVMEFKIYYMHELTPPPGKDAKVKRLHLWKHYCFKPPEEDDKEVKKSIGKTRVTKV